VGRIIECVVVGLQKVYWTKYKCLTNSGGGSIVPLIYSYYV